MEIIKTTALITINDTLWVQMVFFLVFLFVINRILFRPVRRGMADRQAHFSALRQEITAMKAEMDALLKASTDATEAMKASARNLRDELRLAGKQEREAVLTEVRNEIAALQKTAEQELAVAVAQARERAGEEARVLAASIIAHILERSPAK